MGHLNGRLLWHKYAESYFEKAKDILEIGPQGYPSYYESCIRKMNPNVKYKALDIGTDYISGAEKNPNFILSADPMHYPIKENSFDIVFSDQVLQSAGVFWEWYKELIRIVKPGGYVITINAFSYPRCPSPIDGWRVHSEGMIALNEYCKVDTVLSITDSLEMEKYNVPKRPGAYFAGTSITTPYGGTSLKTLRINLAKNYWNKVIGWIPGVRSLLQNPVQVSFDTITIARKPLANVDQIISKVKD